MYAFTKRKQNYINHVAIVLDASSSMHRLKDAVIKVADGLIAHLAETSKLHDQETRITVYSFDSEVTCLIYDKDVLRLPSIRDFYDPYGNTALLDATHLAIEDQRLHSQKYGDHAFLTYAVTDGEENRSRFHPRPGDLLAVLTSLHENETVAALVPNEAARRQALAYGFPEGNVMIWETTEVGVTKVGEVLRTSTDNYMTSRSAGMRKSSTLFSTGLDTVNKKTVNAKTMVSLKRDEYTVIPVAKGETNLTIREWINAQPGHTFQLGKAYYQITKREKIQPQKALALQNIHSGRIYTGPQVRELLGLDATHIRVEPQDNPEYRIFVQSTSVNRKLVPETRVLLLN